MRSVLYGDGMMVLRCHQTTVHHQTEECWMGEYCVGGGAVDWLQLVRTAVIMRGESSEGQHYTRSQTLSWLDNIAFLASTSWSHY